MSNFKLFCYSDFPFLYIFTKVYWKNLRKQNIVFNLFFSNFKVFSSSDFPFLYIHKHFLKNFKNKILYYSYFLVISSYFVIHIFPSYIYIYIYLQKFLENLWKKNILFEWFLSYFVAWFSILIYLRKIFEKFMKTEILYLKQFKWFLSNFKQFCCSDFLFLYICKKIFKKFMKTKTLYL